MGLFRKKNNNYDGVGYERTGFDLNGYDLEGYDKKGFNRFGIDKEGYDKKGFNEIGWNRKGINKFTKNRFDEMGYDIYGFRVDGFNSKFFNRDGINKLTGTKFDQDGFDLDGYDKDGFNEDGFDENGYNRKNCKIIQPSDKFSKLISERVSEFVRVIAIGYNEPTKIKSKLFFSKEEKFFIFSKESESFSKHNVLHIEISKTNKQFQTSWLKPKDTGKSQGDNFESGYTLEIYFDYNDPELKKNLIERLNELGFGSLPSEYSISCHYDEKNPTDERAKDLLEQVLNSFE